MTTPPTQLYTLSLHDALPISTVASLLLDRSPFLAPYRPHLENASLLLSFQTVAEMRFGALKANWGEERKRDLESFFTAFDVVIRSEEHTSELQSRFDFVCRLL